MKAFLFAAVALLTLAAPASAAPAYAAPAHAEPANAKLADPIAAAVASPDRPAADTARDATRKPAALLAFAGIKPGDRVGDIMPGQGYFTRIFSNLVGPTGHVYAIVPAELAQRKPALVEAMNTLATTPNFHNVSPVVVPTASITAPEKLDVAWTSDNYHDVYGFFGADQAAAMDRAVFAALKPGGVFVVIDHVAHDGASATAPKTLHRIDPATVKAQVLAAGFTLEAQSDILQNPADTHDLKVFDPAIRGRTDQFVFKFRKPR